MSDRSCRSGDAWRRGSASLVLLHWLAFYCGIQSMNWCIDTRWMYYVYMVPMYRSYCELLEISEKKIVRYLTAIRMSVRPSVCSSIGVSIIAIKLIVDSLIVDFCKNHTCTYIYSLHRPAILYVVACLRTNFLLQKCPSLFLPQANSENMLI